MPFIFKSRQKINPNLFSLTRFSKTKEEKVMPPTTLPLQDNETQWYYLDLQGKIQGPLTSPQMLNWFNTGYFSMNLMIRRSCDEKFSQLGDFIKLWGCIPFMPGSGPPPTQVQMDDIDEELKINICNILPSASEETVNSVIHALKYVGLETISDLPYIKEDDLILVLKPIQRRKLVKAWHEQFKEKRKEKTLDLNTTLGTEQNVVPSSAVVSSCHSTINWADAMENEDLNISHVDGTSSDWCADKNNNLSRNEPSTNVVSLANNFPFKNLPIKKCIWSRKKCLRLLEICAKHKINILHPNVEDPIAWKKIISEVRAKNFKPDKLECRIKLEELRCEYERIKSEDVKERNIAIFLDTARRVFEADSLSMEQPNNLLSCKKGMRAIEFRQELLKVYTKYKAELVSPDIEEHIVWQKIVSEMRKKYDCGESLCRFELSQVKFLNERLLKNLKNESSFVEAGEAVRILGKPGVPNSQLNELNKEVGNFLEVPISQLNQMSKKVDKYVPPHLRNEKNSQGVPVMPLKTENKTFTIKVSSLSNDVRASDLQELFECYGTIANIYITKNLEDTSSKRFAFIQFHNKEDASRAILAVDGIEYNWKDESDLKVEWAKPSEISGISE